MKNTFKFTILGASALMLMACNGATLSLAEKTASKGNLFQQALYSGYVDLSKEEYSEGDYEDSDRFAEKAIHAGNGISVTPYFPSEWDIKHRELLTHSRARLMTARMFIDARMKMKPGMMKDGMKTDMMKSDLMDSGMMKDGMKTDMMMNHNYHYHDMGNMKYHFHGIDRNMSKITNTVLTVKLAEAQIAFDCWVQEQEENRQQDDISACRNKFGEAMQVIERTMKQETPVKREGQMFELNFDFDSTKLSPEAMKTITSVMSYAKYLNNPMITINGHADAIGTDKYNTNLARRRASAVNNVLVGMGYQNEVDSFGENMLKVETPKRSRANRRVVLYVEGTTSTKMDKMDKMDKMKRKTLEMKLMKNPMESMDEMGMSGMKTEHYGLLKDFDFMQDFNYDFMDVTQWKMPYFNVMAPSFPNTEFRP